MSVYLVTGGAGFIGSHLVDTLIERGHRVRVVDDLSTGHRHNLARHTDAALDFIEAERRPINWAVIWDPKTRIDTLLQPDLHALALALYSFIGMHMTEAAYPLREALAGGEAGNGFELWRRLYQEHKGGSTLIHLQGVRAFRAWPQCKDIRHLNTHVGEWLKAQAKYAATMPPEHPRK